MTRGRPRFSLSLEALEAAGVLYAAGLSLVEIAGALDVDAKTLARSSSEITAAAREANAAVIRGIHLAASKGNVAACRAWLTMTGRKVGARRRRAKPLGKKEQANIDALNAAKDSSWEGLLDVTPLSSRRN